MGDSRPPAAAGVLRGALALRRGHVVASSALLMAHQACEALVPVVVGAAIDRAIRTSDGGALALWIAILAVLFTALTSCFRWGDRFGQRAAEDAGHALRRTLLARALAPAGGVGRMSGELTRIATQDAHQAGMIARAVPGVLAGVAAIVVAAVVLLGISVPLGLLVLLGLPPLLLSAHALGAPLARRAGAEQARAAAAAATATDLVHGLRVLKGIGAEAAAAERYRRVSRESLTASVRAARAEAAYQAATVILNGAFLVLVAFIAARLAVDGRISIGQLIAAVGLTVFLIGPFERLAYLGSAIARCRASAARVAAVLAAPPAVGGTRTLPQVRGELCGRGFTAQAGELTGIVAAAADADALLAGLARDTDDGEVALDGVPLRELEPEALREQLLVAPHDAALFEGSLQDNVAAAARSSDALRAAVAAAAVDEVAETVPEGLATRVGERGRALSGGQRQRVALARVLAADPPVLVLHDPTTAVDTATEARIASALRELRAGRTTLLVTTSPALLAQADRVIVLGEAVETGTHEQLAATSDRYRELVLA